MLKNPFKIDLCNKKQENIVFYIPTTFLLRFSAFAECLGQSKLTDLSFSVTNLHFSFTNLHFSFTDLIT